MIKKSDKADRQDFKILTKPLKIIRSGLFSVRIFNIPNGGKAKFSFAISKKNEKKAVLRNKTKRMGFLAVRKYIGMIKPGILIHFIFNRVPDSQKQVDAEVAEVFRQAGLTINK